MKSYTFARLLVGLLFFFALMAAMFTAFGFFAVPGTMQMRVLTAVPSLAAALGFAATAQIIEALVDTAVNTATAANHAERIDQTTRRALELAEQQARMAAARAG